MKAQVKQIDFRVKTFMPVLMSIKENWKVTVMAEDTFYKIFTQPPNPEILFNYLKSNFPGGSYHSAYEAGFCGY